MVQKLNPSAHMVKKRHPGKALSLRQLTTVIVDSANCFSRQPQLLFHPLARA
jgi:hypothetical protein